MYVNFYTTNYKNLKKDNGRYMNDRKNDGNIKKRTFKFDTKS